MAADFSIEQKLLCQLIDQFTVTLDDDHRTEEGVFTIPDGHRSWSLYVVTGPVTIDGESRPEGYSLSRSWGDTGGNPPGISGDATTGKVAIDEVFAI